MTGCRWHLELVTPPESEPLDVEAVLADHIRSADASADEEYVTGLIRTARRMAERVTGRALATQTWRWVADAFPSGPIVLPRPPVQSVTAITYRDVDGALQTWGGSPSPFDVSLPTGPFASRARITPVYGTTWPVTRSEMDAVTVEFVSGYTDDNPVPADILHGMLLVIGELYKQRSESVHAFNQNAALIRANDLWLGYRVP